jgi:hypothetical protein
MFCFTVIARYTGLFLLIYRRVQEYEGINASACNLLTNTCNYDQEE